MHSAVVVVDSREAAEKESGDVLLSGVRTCMCVYVWGRGKHAWEKGGGGGGEGWEGGEDVVMAR